MIHTVRGTVVYPTGGDIQVGRLSVHNQHLGPFGFGHPAVNAFHFPVVVIRKIVREAAHSELDPVFPEIDPIFAHPENQDSCNTGNMAPVVGSEQADLPIPFKDRSVLDHNAFGRDRLRLMNVWAFQPVGDGKAKDRFTSLSFRSGLVI